MGWEAAVLMKGILRGRASVYSNSSFQIQIIHLASK